MESRLLTCSENVCVWDLANFSPVYKFAHSTAKSFTTIAWDTPDQFICVPAEEKKLVVCDVDQESINQTEYDVGINVSAISCGQKSSCIAIGSATGEVLCWSKKQKKIVKTIAEVPSGVTSLQYNLSDSHIAVGCINGIVNVYNATSGFSTEPLKSDDAPHSVRNLHFHRKHKFLLGSCYDGGQVVLWDINKSCLYQMLPEKHKAPALDLCFSPLGNSVVASVGLDKRIFLHDVRLKSLVQNIRSDIPLRTLDFLPTGVALVVGGSKGMVCTYDLRTSGMLNSFAAHANQVQKIAISNSQGNTSKKKREAKARNVLSPTANSGPNSERERNSSMSSCPDLRKHVLNKNLEASPTGSNQKIPKVQTPATVKNAGSQNDTDEDPFSPPRVENVSENKENLQSIAVTAVLPVDEQDTMETEEIFVHNVDKPKETETQQANKQEVLLDSTVKAFQSLHMDVTNMHFQMIKQFTAQQIEIKELQETCKVNQNMVAEVQYLREENKRLKTLLDSMRSKC